MLWLRLRLFKAPMLLLLLLPLLLLLLLLLLPPPPPLPRLRLLQRSLPRCLLVLLLLSALCRGLFVRGRGHFAGVFEFRGKVLLRHDAAVAGNAPHLLGLVPHQRRLHAYRPTQRGVGDPTGGATHVTVWYGAKVGQHGPPLQHFVCQGLAQVRRHAAAAHG